MRTESTVLERLAGQALIEALNRAHFVTDVEFGDRPDLVMSLNGGNAGVEIVSLLPAKVHEAAKLHSLSLFKKGVSLAKLVVPIEPDEWVKAAIQKKWQIVQAYPKRRRPLRMSLLVHRPAVSVDFEFADSGFINALSYGSARSKHGFDNVFYWSGESIHLLSRPEKHVPPTQVDLTRGYPAWIFITRTSEQAQTIELAESVESTFDVPFEHTKILPPLTAEFKGLRPLEPDGPHDSAFEFLTTRSNISR